MKNISQEAKLSKCYTNHSIRATAVSILDKSGFEARHIMAVSGHKNETSIRSYSKTDICTKKETSETLTTRCELSEAEGLYKCSSGIFIIINNYWLRLSMIAIIVKAKV